MDYKTLYQKNYQFYIRHEKAKKALIFFNYFFTAFYMLCFLALIIYIAVVDFSWANAIKLAVLPAVCLVLVGVFRIAFNRKRPYHKEGANITPLIYKGVDKSFPSRHLASALVIAIVSLSYFTWAGIPLLVLSLPMAYIRFAMGLHYPTDLLAGAILGTLCGLPAFFF
jgi:membrane-associated phospholipid phosphatase